MIAAYKVIKLILEYVLQETKQMRMTWQEFIFSSGFVCSLFLDIDARSHSESIIIIEDIESRITPNQLCHVCPSL